MMTLKVTYFSNNEVHKSIHSNVTHWYYYEGNLVIKQDDEELVQHGVVLLNAETWLSNK